MKIDQESDNSICSKSDAGSIGLKNKNSMEPKSFLTDMHFVQYCLSVSYPRARRYYHHIDVIITTVASQITSLKVVYSAVYSDADQRNIKAPRHWPLCGELTKIGEFPALSASNAANVSIWWRHHVTTANTLAIPELGYRFMLAWQSILSTLSRRPKRSVCNTRSCGIGTRFMGRLACYAIWFHHTRGM